MTERGPRGTHRGAFVSFEGGEGSGKTTQVKLLLERLQRAGQAAVPVKEPGSTPLGERLRGLLKGQVSMTPRAELLLFVAARAELVETLLQPALGRGVHVIADRYADSTVAYQGYGRRLSLEVIAQLNALATRGLTPDVTFLLDIPAEESLRRTRTQAALGTTDAGPAGARSAEESVERFERRSLAFHRRVLNGYRKLAKAEPERWRVLDGTQAPHAIADQVWAHVQPLLKRG